jgi:hypothetical protein
VNIEKDISDYRRIRQIYLPDIILAYNGALTLASSFLGSTTLLKSLDLANIIASDTAPELAQAFVDGERMDDLVSSLALSSREMLRFNQGVVKEERRVRKLEETAKIGSKEEREAKRLLGNIRRKRSYKDMAGKRGWMGETVDIWDPHRIDVD